VLKISDKVHILPLIPHRVALKYILCMILRITLDVNQKKYQASRGLSLAELLVLLFKILASV